MPTEQINLTLGTAGHIDHGKTALVRMLTGCETDRLKEEKERGMSIELGFAPCQIAGTQVGIVDVPGHENFIKTMVAGASGMDGVILVVAADDGVMPQTREHLDILTLLGIRHGMIALTKIDRVSPEERELAEADVAELLRGTFLEGAAVAPVSNITGEGFDRFFEVLAALVDRIQPKRVDGVFRLPVERAFSVQGYGTVVAGIPVAGAAHANDDLIHLPSGTTGRIRRIEVYGSTSETVLAGQCAALNMGHWDHHAIGRGDVVATPGYFAAGEWYAATLRLLPRAKLNLKNGSEVRFHTGTSEVTATIYSLGGERMTGGGEYLAQFRTRTPVVAAPGDRFIVRALSPVQTIGGGMIIEATSGRLKRKVPHLQEDLQERARATIDDRSFVEYCVRRAPSLAAGPAELAVRAKVPHARLPGILDELVRAGRIRALASGLYIHVETLREAGEQILGVVEQFHRTSPESPGLALEQLLQASGIEKVVLEGLIALLKSDGRLVERSGRLASPQHRATLSDEDAPRLAAIEALFRQSAFAPPSLQEVAAKTGIPAPAVEKLLKILREHQRLVPVEDFLFHCDAVARARELVIAHLQKEGRLESVDFKYLLNTTRKFALPLLDYFDRVGVTRRVGNTRYLARTAQR